MGNQTSRVIEKTKSDEPTGLVDEVQQQWVLVRNPRYRYRMQKARTPKAITIG